jgi:6-phosphogluconolactonase
MKRFPLVSYVLVSGLLISYGCKKDGVGEKLDPSLESISRKKFNREEGNGGAVYVLSNQTSGNEVLVYNRSANGSLTAAGSFSTTGNGTGAGLGSQGSVILHDLEGYNYLLAVNAGSNDITVFRVDDHGLTQVDKVSSHGITPISVTAHEDFVYVLNAGGSGNISGFRMTQDGRLSYLQNSTRSLSDDNAGPAQIQFNNEGTQVVVTEKNTNRISTYSVSDHGDPGNVISHSAVGITPFGFDFDNHDHLIVTDAFGGATAQSAVTSFNLSNDGNLSLVDGPRGTNQTSACWLAITNNGRYCYATNTGSASITGYSIHDGALTRLNADGVTAVTGTTPIDVSLSRNSKFLYNVNSFSHSITFFSVNEDGSLNAIGNVNGLPQGAGGIAAR